MRLTWRSIKFTSHIFGLPSCVQTVTSFNTFITLAVLCQQPRGLRHGSVVIRLLGLRVWILPGARMSVSCECCQVEASATGRSLIQRSPTECGVPECDIETSRMSQLRPTGVVKPWKRPNNVGHCHLTVIAHLLRLHTNRIEAREVVKSNRLWLVNMLKRQHTPQHSHTCWLVSDPLHSTRLEVWQRQNYTGFVHKTEGVGICGIRDRLDWTRQGTGQCASSQDLLTIYIPHR
jgi:hypothetical protein